MSETNSKNGKRTGRKVPENPVAAGAGQRRVIRKPDPRRMQILRSLPLEVKQSLTPEEANAFLFESTWPDSLLQKLKDYLVEDNAH